MFEATQLVFYYAVSPVHMGAGSAIGAIDSPIQREVHTKHPMFAGSGLKGALRHHFNRAWPRAEGDDRKPNSLINRIFGPDTGASDFAGALSLSDAQLVALPVRSLKGGFAYVTSPLALARLQRLANQAEIECKWQVPNVPENTAAVATDALLQNKGTEKKLILEAFEFIKADADEVNKIATWIADYALPGASNKFFADKLKSDLVVLNDTDFSHFARHAMVVEPHVRINDESGTADDGGLFYVENLPPETLMVGLAQASIERFKKDSRNGDSAPLFQADEVLKQVFAGGNVNTPGIGGKLLQIGGDASTGRGLVVVQSVQPGKKES